MDEIVLAHYGKKGMKWGVRKDETGAIKRVSTITRAAANDNARLKIVTSKRMKDRSNDEIRFAVKRLRLLKGYRKSGITGGKNPEKMSNAQLEDEIKKSKFAKSFFKKGRFFLGLKKLREMKDLSDKSLKDYIERGTLEKQYKDLAGEDYEYVKAFISAIFSNS